MSFSAPKGWDKESEKLYIHSSDVRIQLMTYRGQEGWFIVPASLDEAAIPFAATPEGRTLAFEAFAQGKGAAKTKAPRKPKDPSSPRAKAAAKAAAAEENEEADEDEEKEEGDAEESA